MATPARSRAGAFTLIELLVVIAIIGILAGMLMPAIVTVRASAYQLKCQANMRQIHGALIAYASDNRGHLPAMSHWQTNGTLAPACDGGTGNPLGVETWGQNLNVFLGREIPMDAGSISNRSRLGIWNCPTNKWQRYVMGNGSDWINPAGLRVCGYNTSYMGNNAYQRFNGAWTKRFLNARVGALTKPSEMFAFMDGQYLGCDASRNTGDGSSNEDGIPKGKEVGMEHVRYAHKKMANVCFADGHIEIRSEIQPSSKIYNAWYAY